MNTNLAHDYTQQHTECA